MINTYIQNKIAFIEFSNGSRPNIIDSTFLSDLQQALDEFENSTEEFYALILKGTETSGFVAGADIKSIAKVTTREEALAICTQGQETFRRLNNFKGIPTVAIIEGPCLGGGMELALACNYRIAVNSPKTTLGLPEVNLGIIPGFGGTVRLSRLVGLESALTIICSGKRYDVKKAAKLRLVDEVVLSERLAFDSVVALINDWVNVRQTYTNRKVPFNPKESRVGRYFLYKLAMKGIKKKSRGYPAPVKAAEVIYQGLKTTEAQAYQLEREAVAELLIGEVSKNLINLFFLQEKHKKTYPNRPKNLPKGDLPTEVAILGAGLMGGGLAQLSAYKGFQTHLKDIKQEQLDLAVSTAKKLTTPLVARGKLSEEKATELLGRINPTLEYDNLATADFVVEAVVENFNIKKNVLADLENTVSDTCIIATNTSSLSVNALAAECRHPERFIGMHFFSPVHKMPLVEIIPGEKTSEETIERTFQLAVKLGKIPVFCTDQTCFIVNRVLGAYLNKASHLLIAGYTPDQIDKAMRNYGMPLGPCELMDEVGIMVSGEVSNRLQETWPEHFKVYPLIEMMVEKNLLGKKATNEGFYRYYKGIMGKKKREVSKETMKLVQQLRENFVGTSNERSIEEILSSTMQEEAQRMLDDGTVDSPDAINLAMILGTGFPPFRGGLITQTEVGSN